MIHRDLKSDNVVMSKRPNNASEFQTVVYKIIDISFKQGSPTHMSPEAHEGIYDCASDIWSFGVVIWEIFTQQTPFSEFTNKFALTQHIARDKQTLPIPKDLNERVLQLLVDTWNLEPEKRPNFDRIHQVISSIKENVSVSERLREIESDYSTEEEDDDNEYENEKYGVVLNEVNEEAIQLYDDDENFERSNKGVNCKDLEYNTPTLNANIPALF